MTLQLQTRGGFFGLHGSTGLTDWDMDKEMKLTTTTDQFYQEDDILNDQYLVQWHYARISRKKDECVWHDPTSDSFVQPNLWLIVDPNLACPIQYAENRADQQTICESTERVQMPQLEHAETRHSTKSEFCTSTMLEKPLHSAPSCVEYMIKAEDGYGASWVDFHACQPAKSGRKGRATKSRSQDCKTMKVGGWPRPPVNYCILIAMALSSSHTGSLNVQQIYNFTREHFPFFQTAPDGWKNTIRHNLCFSNSFRKTPHQLCRDGKRKSCLWHLTLDGRRRLRDEIHMLSEESFRELKRSMSHPDVVRTLFAL